MLYYQFIYQFNLACGEHGSDGRADIFPFFVLDDTQHFAKDFAFDCETLRKHSINQRSEFCLFTKKK
jgi:hypothetical protein